MRRTFTFLLIFLAVAMVSRAQDIHFSQFWASPLTLGPAVTGNFDGTYRAGAIYRSQWTSVPSAYKTFSAFYDHNLGGGLYSGDATSAGIVFYNDNAGDANFSSTYILISGAYHKSLGINNRLSLGLQAGYGQKKLDYSKLQLSSMWNGQDFSNTSGEIFANEGSSSFDLNAGLDFNTLINDDMAANVGVSFWHLLSPEEEFVTGGPVYNLGMKIVGHGGVDYKLNEKVSIHPKFMYLRQSGAQEFNIGSDVGYKLENESFPATLYGGVWYRVSDAVIPYVGMEYQNFRLGLSYDVNVSSLNEATGYKGGFEISLLYIGVITSDPTRIVVPCIRF